LHLAHFIGNAARGIGAVVDRSVDHALIHTLPQNARGTVDERLHENRGIDFIDVILVHHCRVKAVQRVGDFLRQVRLAEVEHIGEESAEQSDNDRDAHEQIFCVAAGRSCRRVDTCASSKHRSKEMLKAVVDANQSADHR
jgi:hypothetical protein